MKTYKRIPSHYRRVADGEIIRKGDIIKFTDTDIETAYGLIGVKVKSFNAIGVYRRRHVAIKPSTVKAAKRVAGVEKNPLVVFSYPLAKNPYFTKIRTVRVISANEKYIVGLEVSDKNRFKKFLTNKASGMKLTEYSPGSMP